VHKGQWWKDLLQSFRIDIGLNQTLECRVILLALTQILDWQTYENKTVKMHGIYKINPQTQLITERSWPVSLQTCNRRERLACLVSSVLSSSPWNLSGGPKYSTQEVQSFPRRNFCADAVLIKTSKTLWNADHLGVVQRSRNRWIRSEFPQKDESIREHTLP
jgi:hypothetical protein